MSGLGNAWKDKLINLLLGGVVPTIPGTVYVALYTTAPTASGGGTEVTGGAYVRVPMANNPTNWPTASGGIGQKMNGVAINFPIPTASWGRCIAFAVHDSPTADSVMVLGSLIAPFTPTPSNFAVFAPSTLFGSVA